MIIILSHSVDALTYSFNQLRSPTEILKILLVLFTIYALYIYYTMIVIYITIVLIYAGFPLKRGSLMQTEKNSNREKKVHAHTKIIFAQEGIGSMRTLI